MLLARSSRRKRHQPAAPPEGWFVSPSGSSSGDGTIGDPWDLQTALDGGPTGNEVGPGDTVWIRAGTYTAPNAEPYDFPCALLGTKAAPIYFRNYPGEHVTIDGNYNPAVRGEATSEATINVTGTARYVRLRSIEVLNSQVDRHKAAVEDHERDAGITADGLGCGVINCIVHDCSQGILPRGISGDGVVYGNIVLHNGVSTLISDKVAEYAIDLTPVGGQSISLGNFTRGGSSFAHDHNGNFLVVAVATANNTYYSDYAVTYDSVAVPNIGGYDAWSLTRYHGIAGNNAGSKTIALFALATTNTGSHTLTVTNWGTGTCRVMAQSLLNVDHADAVTQNYINAAHTDTDSWMDYWDAPPLTNAIASDTGHWVVDAAAWHGSMDLDDYNVYGGNSLVDDPDSLWKTPGVAPSLGMSYRAGAASPATTQMGWSYTCDVIDHGHGMYIQNTGQKRDVGTTVDDHTVTDSGNHFYADEVGAKIQITGAGTGGTLLVTTITQFNSAGSVEVAEAPHATLASTPAVWTLPKTVRHNITYDTYGNAVITGTNTYAIQTYGTGSAGFWNSLFSGNVGTLSSWILGGSGSFDMRDTQMNGNYTHDGGANFGYGTTALPGYEAHDNYIHSSMSGPGSGTWGDVVFADNTFIGTWGPTGFQAAFPDNTYQASDPVSNLIVVAANEWKDTYDAKFGHVIVYNWSGGSTVDINLSSIVPSGTAVDLRNAQDFYATPQWSGTYTSGTISVSMSGLTVMAGIGNTHEDVPYEPLGTTGPEFAVFIVMEQGRF